MLLFASNTVVFKREVVVFSQSVSDPVFRAQDAAKVGMAGEQDADKIVGFSFVPVGNAPDTADGLNFR